MLLTIFMAFLFGLLVAGLGMFFDRTPDNRYAWIAGGLVFLTIILVHLI